MKRFYINILFLVPIIIFTLTVGFMGGYYVDHINHTNANSASYHLVPGQYIIGEDIAPGIYEFLYETTKTYKEDGSSHNYFRISKTDGSFKYGEYNKDVSEKIHVKLEEGEMLWILDCTGSLVCVGE